MATKLDASQRHMLKLIHEGQQNREVWAVVGKMIYPLLQKGMMPVELVEHESTTEGGRARLTEQGQVVFGAAPWFTA